jgi:DNA-binding cell septation regulator SpoVG
LLNFCFWTAVVDLVSHNGYVLAMVGHLKNVSSTFVQMPNRSKSVEFTTVSHTIANTMLAAVLFF